MLLEGEFAREQLEHADACGPDVAREVDLLLDAAPAAAESGVTHSTDTRRESAKPPGVSVSAAAGATHATTHTNTPRGVFVQAGPQGSQVWFWIHPKGHQKGWNIALCREHSQAIDGGKSSQLTSIGPAAAIFALLAVAEAKDGGAIPCESERRRWVNRL